MLHYHGKAEHGSNVCALNSQTTNNFEINNTKLTFSTKLTFIRYQIREKKDCIIHMGDAKENPRHI